MNRPGEGRPLRPAARRSTQLADALGTSRILVFVGQGGVGKTSLAAATATGLARAGHRVAVLTVDPAPRLADALGIAGLGDEPQRVPMDTRCAGRLDALRLDVRGAFDRVVESHASSPRAAAAILAHPVYRAISAELGGAESFMAFQRLGELEASGAYDRIVVDTPPAANTSDVLAAPSRLAALLDTGALGLLADPALAAARVGGTLARAVVTMAVAAVERVTGAALVRDIAGLATDMQDVLGGLAERTRRVDGLLRSPGTAFVLVARPRPADVDAALAFRRSLAEAGIRVAAIAVNRITPPRLAPPVSPAPEDGAVDTDHTASARRREALGTMRAHMDALRAGELRALEQLEAATADVPVVQLPARDDDAFDVRVLADVAAALGYD
jgi:anion-transporting  ArsA/GET3 family ATPase